MSRSMDALRRRPTVLGIHLGSREVQAVVVGLEGELLARATVDFAVTTPRPGWSESDPVGWLNATVEAVRNVVGRAGDVKPVGIGLAGQKHGLVVTDGRGHPLRPAMSGSDRRAVDELRRYRELPQRIHARQVNPLSPGNAGPMLAWLGKHESAAYSATRWALQPKDWLRAQLTGRFCTEPSDASATLLYDAPGDRWDDELIDALDLYRHVFPDIVTSGDHAGGLTPEAARLLGIPAGTPVAAGAADTAAAALGSGLVDAGTAQLVIGSSMELVRPSDRLPNRTAPDPVTHIYRAAAETGWYVTRSIPMGTGTLAWVCNTLGAGREELYAAAEGSPRPGAPFFLPHLHGEQLPRQGAAMHAAWTDLTTSHGRADMLRAALEGVAFAIRDALQRVPAPGDQVSSLRLPGGEAMHPAWRQMLADIVGLPLGNVDATVAAPFGAAMLAGRAAQFDHEIPPRARYTSSTANPRPHICDLYQERYLFYTRKVQALRLFNNLR